MLIRRHLTLSFLVIPKRATFVRDLEDQARPVHKKPKTNSSKLIDSLASDVTGKNGKSTVNKKLPVATKEKVCWTVRCMYLCDCIYVFSSYMYILCVPLSVDVPRLATKLPTRHWRPQ
jgi:hypothetical protein